MQDGHRSKRLELAGSAFSRVAARLAQEKVRAASNREEASRAQLDRAETGRDMKRGREKESGRTTISGDSSAPLPYHSGCEPTDGG